MSGEAGGGYCYPDSEDEADRPVKLTRHADHDPSLICRPALGYGLCEVLESGGCTESADGFDEGSWGSQWAES